MSKTKKVKVTKKTVKTKKPKDNKLRMIRTAMKKVQERGIYIEDNTWGATFDDNKGYYTAEEGNGVCALGALLVYKNGKVDYTHPKIAQEKMDKPLAAAYILGVNESWVDCFIYGFDGGQVDHGEMTEDLDIICSNCNEVYESTYSCSDGEPILSKTKNRKVLENREAFNMGCRLRKEFIE